MGSYVREVVTDWMLTVASVVLILVALAIAPGGAFGAACSEAPEGQQNCDRFYGRAPGVGTPNVVINIVATPTGTPKAAANAIEVRGPDTTPKAIVDASGTAYLDQPYGQYMRSANITIANVATPVAITYDATPVFERLLARTPAAPSSDPTSDIYVTVPGTYEIIVSAIADLTTGTNKHVGVWLRKNGANVTYSNTWVQLPNASTEYTVAVAFVEQFAAGDRMTIMLGSDDTNVRLLAAAPVTTPSTSPIMPGSPSVIVTVKMIAK